MLISDHIDNLAKDLQEIEEFLKDYPKTTAHKTAEDRTRWKLWGKKIAPLVKSVPTGT